MMRNIIRFAESGRELELVAEGSLWPAEVVVDGEAWLMGMVVDSGPSFTVREYVYSTAPTRGQRLLKAITGGA